MDTFLEEVAEDYEAVLKENTLLKEQLEALEERTRGMEEREQILQQTLVTAQRMSDEMRETARREAEVIRKQAEIAAERGLESLRAEEAAVRADIGALKRQRRHVAEGLRSTLQMYQRLIEQDLAGGADIPGGPAADAEASTEAV